jgi:hypothetical protein
MEWQDPFDEVDNVKRIGKRYAIADDQRSCKRRGDYTFPSSEGYLPRVRLLRWNKVLKINVIEYLVLKTTVSFVIC